MISRYRYFRVIVIALFSLAAAACKQDREPCLSVKTAILNVRTLHFIASATAAVDTAIPNPVWVAITDTAAFAFIYTQRDSFNLSLSSVSLAAGSDNCLSRWAFTTDSFKHQLDTLDFYYRRQAHFISNACGYMYYYTLDSVLTTHHNIDSVHIVNPSVTTNVNTRHLALFVHPDY